ncbi:response regulator [Dactylosporangium matsuzakiense]|uniref:DNA-binding response regulator n=1 Tax=Dactylosporangium matsuzakiense TaxID=53360 RepID=A0A9W6KN22_9ACTN|nr:response regulator transcription factor [Dactylosporangium matsuzakiense]UWZ46879.1 response regulator transcription factor [Dactylosporangium matsuzakiense]GLL04233.1 DNA-binding response regulator [Dactylosporangium matsuzakiense]
MIRVLIADDQPIARQGLATLLTTAPDIEVVGLAGDGRSAVAAVASLRPDVVVMDVRMPVLDGIAATAEITAAGPARVLVLTTFDVDQYVYDALLAGASGFLLKDCDAAELVRAVRVIAAGDALLAPAVTRRLLADFQRARPPRPIAEATSRLATLTPREREVLAEVARGLANAEIAERLHVAEETVKTHVGRVLHKLGLRDRAQAIVVAYETRLVTPPGS